MSASHVVSNRSVVTPERSKLQRVHWLSRLRHDNGYGEGMIAAVLSIGTELTRGEIVNTNASWLGEQLTQLGLEVLAADTVDDNEGRIIAALKRLANHSDVIVCTGGLGPTTDDITSNTVAKLLGVKTVRDDASIEAMNQRFVIRGRELNESNSKQADFPEGASVMSNDHGTAPGFSVSIGTARAYFMPGVPMEMRPMFHEHVAPKIKNSDAGIAQVRLRSFGLPESRVNEKLRGLEEENDVTVGYRAHFPEIEVKLLARRSNQGEALKAAETAATETRHRLKNIIFGEGDIELAEAVGVLLSSRKLTLGVAEACTGGLLGELCTERSATQFFSGGVIAYTNQLKTELLGVPAETLEQHGAVSAPVVKAMALGAMSQLGVSVGVSISGIAGPSGGTEEKPVGTIHYAVATDDGVTVAKMRFPGTRTQNRRLAAYNALNLLRQILISGHPREDFDPRTWSA